MFVCVCVREREWERERKRLIWVWVRKVTTVCVCVCDGIVCNKEGQIYILPIVFREKENTNKMCTFLLNSHPLSLSLNLPKRNKRQTNKQTKNCSSMWKKIQIRIRGNISCSFPHLNMHLKKLNIVPIFFIYFKKIKYYLIVEIIG